MNMMEANKITVEINDFIEVIEAQRNGALKESALNLAYARTLERKVKELEEKINGKPAESVPSMED